MKKLFSIICSMAIVLSASAAGQFNDVTVLPQRSINIEKKAAPVKAQLQAKATPVNVKAAFDAKKDSKVAVNGQLKSTRQFAAIKAEKQLKPTSKVKNAPKATQSVYNITLGKYAMQDYGEGNIYYAVLSDDQAYRFDFDFYLSDETATDLELGVIYTIDDIGTDYSYGTNQLTGDYIDYAGLSFTKTLVDGLVRLDISVTDVNGNTWNMVYQEEPLPVATDTINVVFAMDEVEFGDYTERNGVFQFVGENANYISYLAANSTGAIAGSYTNDDMLLDYTGLYTIVSGDTTSIEALAADMVVAFADNIYTVDAYLLGEDAHCYHVQMSYYQEPFIPTGDTIEVIITDPMTYSYYASQGDWWLRGANDSYKVNLDLVNHDATSPVGTYALENCIKNFTYITDKTHNDTTYSIKGLDASVWVSEEDTIFVVADMLCSDGNVYHVTLFYAIPKALYTETIEADNVEIQEGWLGYTLVASNAAYSVSISLTSKENGEYVVDKKGTITNVETSEASTIYSGTITLNTAANGSISVTGTVLCENNTEYTLNLTYVVPEPQREETIVGNGKLDVYASDGVWQALAVNAAQNRMVVVTVKGSEAKAGTYGYSDLYGGKNYNYVLSVNGTDTVYYLALSANFTVAIADEVATLNGSMIAQQNGGTEVVKFNFTMTCAIKEAIDGKTYDAEDSDFNHNFATYTINDVNLAKYHSLYIEAIDGESYYLILDVTLAEQDNSLVPGVYPVASEYDPQSVFGGYYDEENGFIPSFAASLVNQEGKLYYNEMWFLTEGAVTVNADGSIDVEAVNSYGRIIRSHLGKAEGVENTDAAVKAAKVLRNGQLIIIKNGVEYNALGTIVK